MKRLVPVACGLILLFGISSCGSNDPVKEHVKLMNRYADALEEGAGQPKIDQIRKRIEENANKLKAMAEVERKKLAEQHKSEYQTAHARVANALARQRNKQVGDSGIPDLSGMTGTGGRK